MENYEQYLTNASKELKEEFQKICSGELLPQLYEDFTFKQVYNPDTHPERVAHLFGMIFGKEAQVISSLSGETPKASLYSKKTIVDLLAKLSNGEILDFEMQSYLQDFIVQRTNIYAADMMLLQYSVAKNQKKSEMSFEDIPHSYLVVFMKESPELFKDNSAFIHVKEEWTDTGIELPILVTMVYIELDKCLRYVREYGYPGEQEELCKWLVLMADTNSPEATQLADEDEEKKLVLEELEQMSMNKEVLITMLADKYEEIIRYSEKQEARKKGLKEGLEKGLEEGREKGLEEGREEALIDLIRAKMKKSLNDEIVADIFEVDIEYVMKIRDFLEESPSITSREIVKALRDKK